MAKERLINTRFWQDGWIRRLNPLDRYLYLYFLTNEYTNISGIYELPLSTISYGCGIDERDLEKTMLPRLQPKIFYKNGWVIIVNFLKHQRMKSIKIERGVILALKNVPKPIFNFAKSKGYGYDMDMISSHIIYSNLNPNYNYNHKLAETSSALRVKKMKKNSFNYKETNHEDSYEDVVDLETGEKSVPKRENTKKYPNARKVFALFGNVPANWRINKTQLQSAENLFTERGIEQIIKALQFYKENKDEEYCPVINSPYDLDSKWAKLVVFKKKQ